MGDTQDAIYYLPGDSLETIRKSPLLQKFEKHGVEVLLLDDPIDEFCMQHLAEYEKFKVKSIAKEDGGIMENDELEKKKQLKIKEMYKPLTDWWKDHLGQQVEKVAISTKLVEEPAFVFTSQYGYSAHMEKVNRAQAFANQEKASSYMLAKKHFELNPSHPIMKELLDRVESSDGTPDKETIRTADLVFETAMLNSGFILDDTFSLNAKIQELIKVDLGLSRDAPVEEIEISIEDLEDDEIDEDLDDDFGDDDIDFDDEDDDFDDEDEEFLQEDL